MPSQRAVRQPPCMGLAANGGAASLAISMGWKLVQGMLNRPAKPTNQPIQVRSAAPVQSQSRMKIHITTAWMVGDSSGNWREGRSEQTIEIE